MAPQDAIFVSADWEASEDVRDALLADGKPVVQMTERLRGGFDQVAGAVKHATPEFMRRYFEAQGKSLAVRDNRPQLVRLLQYCLSDMILGCPADTDGGEHYKRLCGLPIIPTAGGGYQTIRLPRDSVKGSVLVATAQESELLAALHADIVDPALPGAVLDHLRSEAMATYTNVKVLTAELVAVCLERVLPAG